MARWTASSRRHVAGENLRFKARLQAASERFEKLPLMASPSILSWNQIAGFLESLRRLKDSGFAA